MHTGPIFLLLHPLDTVTWLCQILLDSSVAVLTVYGGDYAEQLTYQLTLQFDNLILNWTAGFSLTML